MLPFSKTKTSGAIVIDGKHVADTLQCVHCGSHEMIVPGSGKKRGLCPMCNMGFLCGKPACMIHIPFEAKLDYQEAKIRNDSQKTIEQLEKKYPLIGKVGF